MSRIPRSIVPVIAALATWVGVDHAAAQCLLANPSFELPGSGGVVFAGWEQSGSVGSSPDATHGARAARVSGPDTGGWDVSSYWQGLDTAPGEQWNASARVRVSASRPLTGGSLAIVNVEWRDAAGNLLDYESHAVADASTAPGQALDVAITSQSAPPGTATARLLLGVLQAPGEPVPDVIYDEATFEKLGPPTLDDLQWNDFPGGRTVQFAGRSWRVKGPGFYGPGPSLFADSASHVWVDAEDRLHLTIRNVAGSWYSTEVVLEEALGYGDYIFTTVGRLDALDPQAVLGMFLWQYARCYDPADGWWNPYDEIDVEFSRWGTPGNDVAQFVAQPYDFPGNLERFGAAFSPGERTSHAFRWLPDRVEYRSWRGGPLDEATPNLIHAWTYTGYHIPRPEQPRVHLNLWQFDGPPAADQEVVLDRFVFVPVGAAVDVPAPRPSSPGRLLSLALPNPFRSATVIRYVLPRAGGVEIVIHDVAGRLVRRLDGPDQPAGDHGIVWDGRDEAGRTVASGVYVYRLRSGALSEARRIVRIR